MTKEGIIIIMILICGFILTSGCSELGIHIDDTDNRSHAIPFFGEPINETNNGANNTLSGTTPPEGGIISILIDLFTIVAILLIITYTVLRIIEWILKEIKLEDQPPLNP